MKTALEKYKVEHEVITVNFMNENIIPMETLAQKVEFCETRIAMVQTKNDATFEELEAWLKSREEVMKESNIMADKL